MTDPFASVETITVPTGRTARQLWNAVGPPWRAVVTLGRGETEAGTLVPDPSGRLTPTGRPGKIRVSRTVACESEAVRLITEDGHRAVAYWVRTDGGTWAIQGAWWWIPPEVPRPVDIAELITLIGAGQTPPAAPAPPAPAASPRRVSAAPTPDQALDRLRREWPAARSAAARQEIAATAAAIKVVRDAPPATGGTDVAGALLAACASRGTR